ncbi:MAG: aminomethyl-transferring glycine dehydrogenase subunit GcvPA [Verrucomicrobiae bacterium]|nr:aminomethyl-transferring glycine dehydrogenase subunit GcvPA [Verrucomicrobiae bacterium]
MDYIPNTDAELDSMLRDIGVASFEELIATVPKSLRISKLNLPSPLSEPELQRELITLSRRNTSLDQVLNFIGAGAYEHFVPSAIDHLVMRGEFYTAYTPYQAEASQGTLQAIYEYQSMMCRLTAMDISNASLYDGASALAEAALLCLAQNPRRKTLLISAAIHPEYRQVVRTYTQGLPIKLVEVPVRDGVTDTAALRTALNADVAGVLMQSPNFFGCIEEMADASQATHVAGALFAACVNPISLGVLAPPGEYGADIACGEGQPLGIPVAYGGPWLGFFATTKKIVHKICGRLVGRTCDVDGQDGFVLTLQAREQHIRREKATSNICTNQSLLALRACVFMSLMGKQGMKELAELNLIRAHEAAETIAKITGYRIKHSAPFFNEFVVTCPMPAAELSRRLEAKGIFAGLPIGGNDLLVCVTETKSRGDIEAFCKALAEVK